MAQITLNTSPDQDAAAQIAFNRAIKDPSLTFPQWVKTQLLSLVDGWVAQYDNELRLNKAALYKVATPEDKAAVDAILAKYQAP